MYRFVKSFRKKFIVQIAQSFVRVFVQVAQMAKLGPQRALAAQRMMGVWRPSLGNGQEKGCHTFLFFLR